MRGHTRAVPPAGQGWGGRSSEGRSGHLAPGHKTLRDPWARERPRPPSSPTQNHPELSWFQAKHTRQLLVLVTGGSAEAKGRCHRGMHAIHTQHMHAHMCTARSCLPWTPLLAHALVPCTHRLWPHAVARAPLTCTLGFAAASVALWQTQSAPALW